MSCPRGSEACLPREARAMELVRAVSGQVREMEASRVEDQGGQINHVSARQGGEGNISSGLLPGRPSHRDSRSQSRSLSLDSVPVHNGNNNLSVLWGGLTTRWGKREPSVAHIVLPKMLSFHLLRA